MSKKKPRLASRATPAQPVLANSSTAMEIASAAAIAGNAEALPRQAAGGAGTVTILACMMFLAPALGVPHEELLQDTFKSMLVCFAALVAALQFFWYQRRRTEALQWHPVLWLPLVLMAHALGSMAWSHTYLAGVEAIRWFVFSLIAWLGLNTLQRERFGLLAHGIHWGATVASLWAVLQFWGDFKLFPQGPNPASTFINRNFFAEFLVCTLPFSIYLLLRARNSSQVALLTASVSMNILALLMTGTRSALLAFLVLCAIFIVIVWRHRSWLAQLMPGKTARIVAGSFVLLTVSVLGMLPTGNAPLVYEHAIFGRGTMPLERSFARVASMASPAEYSAGTFSVRLQMWAATARMMAAHPITGVGAGAWEVHIPRYQTAAPQIETDYYAHNEFVQLLSEYGVVGWVFLLALLAYLGRAAWRTVRATSQVERQEAPLRATALASMLAFLVVSHAGFPWHLATTGALFALLLGVLIASDARLGVAGRLHAHPLRWSPRGARVLLAATLGCLVLATHVSRQAIACERDIVQAASLSLRVASDPHPEDPRWDDAKARILELTQRGIQVNPHYRKLTAVVADNLARWGDWKNAIRIWDSLVQSRPYVIALLTNISRGYLQERNFDAARDYLERARRVQPDSPAVRSLEVMVLAHTGREAEAVQRMKAYFRQGIYDFDLANSAFQYGSYVKDWQLALDGLHLIIQGWPERAVSAWLNIGNVYANELHDEARALEAYRNALQRTPQELREATLRNVPAAYRARL